MVPRPSRMCRARMMRRGRRRERMFRRRMGTKGRIGSEADEDGTPDDEKDRTFGHEIVPPYLFFIVATAWDVASMLSAYSSIVKELPAEATGTFASLGPATFHGMPGVTPSFCTEFAPP